jgi:hypothetical protein
MRTISVNLYKYNELTDEAKQKAREWFTSDGDIFHWHNEYINSINTFCEHFSVKLKDWNIQPFGSYHFSTDADNSHFRGIKLKDIDHDYMPTGFCADSSLWMTFHDRFKTTGNAKQAFNDALDEVFKDWRNDWENAYSDECVAKNIIINEYEFTESGAIA